MSEQRFTITNKEWICYNGGYAYTVSNGECEFALWEDEEDAQKVCDYLNEQQATIEHLKKRLYDFEKRKIIEESEIDEDVIPKVKLLRTELFGEKYE